MSTTEIPGIQYPAHLEEGNPTDAAIRNIYDNLFYLRKVALNPVVPVGLGNQIKSIVQNLTLNTGSSVVPSTIIGTHVQRVTIYGGVNVDVGTLFYEYDRNALYIASDALGINTWVLVEATMYNLIASRPTDLTLNDVGFRFVDSTTDTQAEWMWTGTEFVTIDYLQEILDAATTTITTLLVLSHLTTNGGGAGNGFGAAILFKLHNSVQALKEAGFIDIDWDVSATTNEGSRFIFRLMRGGVAAASVMEVNKALLLITGTFLWKSGTAFTGELFHANSAARVYTFPDADGNIPYETADITNNNVVLGGGGALIKDSGFALFGSSPYTVSNVTTTRSYDADVTTVDELADVLGTLIQDLQAKGVLS